MKLYTKIFCACALPPNKRKTMITSTLALLKHARDHYARYDEVDRSAIALFIDITLRDSPSLCDEESQLIQRSLSFDNLKSGRADRFKRVYNSIVTHPLLSLFEKYEDGDEDVWGKAQGRIDCSAEECTAWIWNFMSYVRLR